MNDRDHLTTGPPAAGLGRGEWAVMFLVSLAMIAATALHAWPISWVEVIGFITGGICVWLAVRQHAGTWPIGLANNIAFFVLFSQARLYADAGLQVVYFALGIYGWWNWLHGGTDRTRLPISRARTWEWLALAAFVSLGTWTLRELLIAVNGAAPFWDSHTTVLSLAAQYLMCRKRLEHWLVWMAADIIYIPLYLSRELPLTAILYGVLLTMCVLGWLEWRRRAGAA